jgi:AcrR family transcriptional regulator
VATAIELADRQPTGEITMRALAAELGVRSPMALYRYVGSKNGLADLMADQVYGQLTVVRGDGWRPALRSLGRSGWDAVQRHPWFARLAFSRPPLRPPRVAHHIACAKTAAPTTVFAHAISSPRPPAPHARQPESSRQPLRPGG